MSDKKMKDYNLLQLPLYWEADLDGKQWIKNSSGEWVCMVDSKSTAEAIIHAVNTHDTLQSERDQYKEQRDIAVNGLKKLKENVHEEHCVYGCSEMIRRQGG